ncbi:bifunctional molybdopterin-guanine dinucleotide biosynthesis adaptor protein MobB/molybdopterin molybdotransferase MoeA [Profundibacter sp.]|uniref:bifunctional molybdopterin-guanine dinucleotide biosynthesis adaptor protein MobB/molybdopterin molybdotransferase MoeA n=1 Tax=Profundibacter sp. TaxID=3101071 RepID=UPI003D0D6F09
MRVFGVVGWKNSGKTGLMERLVAEITSRGFTVATLKHAHHSFDVDHQGKDSYRHREAGATEVLLASRQRWALMHELRGQDEPVLEQLLAHLSPNDLVLIEGYKRDDHPKIEANRKATGQPLLALEDETVRAVASDNDPQGLSVPVFNLDDTVAIADFILQETGLVAKPVAGVPDIAAPVMKDDCFALPPGVEWMPVDDALAHLKDRLGLVVGTEEIAVPDAAGRVLAVDQMALRSNPPGANSAVDGYGFAHADTMDGPQVLPLVDGRAAAGEPFEGVVPAGHAIRILTGALIPEGVDTVVMQEDVNVQDGHVAFQGPVKPNANTRKAGEDVEAGQLALAAGHKLRSPDLALLTGLGVASVTVYKRLRVGVLSTGDEIVPADGGASPKGKTYDANRPMLLALAAEWGHEAVDLGHVKDDRALLKTCLDDAREKVDVILTSGGASAGDEDHVSALLKEEGALEAWRIALKPGRPLALGMWHGVPVFGLPGNPVAAFVTAAIFARPSLSALSGAGWVTPQGFMVPAAFSKSKKPGRREYLRARMGADGRVEVFKSEGSGRISGLAWANGLVELPDGALDINEGDMVRFLPYGSLGIPD